MMEGRTRHSVKFRILLNMYDGRTRFARVTREEIEKTFEGNCLKTTIRASVRVREAAARGLPVDRVAPRAPIVADYRALARSDGVYLTRNDLPPEEICLAGDFNDWIPDSGVVLEHHQGGGWTKFIPLGPGRYEYKLVVKGRWIADPLNPRKVPNQVGSINSVLEIED